MKTYKQFIEECLEEEAPAVNAGGGSVAGIGVGKDGEPGMSKKDQKKYTKRRKDKTPLEESRIPGLGAMDGKVRLKDGKTYTIQTNQQQKLFLKAFNKGKNPITKIIDEISVTWDGDVVEYEAGDEQELNDELTV